MLLDCAGVVGSVCINGGIIVPVGCRITENVFTPGEDTCFSSVFKPYTV